MFVLSLSVSFPGGKGNDKMEMSSGGRQRKVKKEVCLHILCLLGEERVFCFLSNNFCNNNVNCCLNDANHTFTIPTTNNPCTPASASIGDCKILEMGDGDGLLCEVLPVKDWPAIL